MVCPKQALMMEDCVLLGVHCLPAAVVVREDVGEDGAVGVLIDDSVRDCDVAIEADAQMLESRLADPKGRDASPPSRCAAV
jgi:hypothetical protein